MNDVLVCAFSAHVNRKAYACGLEDTEKVELVFMFVSSVQMEHELEVMHVKQKDSATVTIEPLLVVELGVVRIVDEDRCLELKKE